MLPSAMRTRLATVIAPPKMPSTPKRRSGQGVFLESGSTSAGSAAPPRAVGPGRPVEGAPAFAFALAFALGHGAPNEGRGEG